MRHILESLTTGATLLLVFLIISNPKRVNLNANRWLAFFLFCVFIVMLDELLLWGNIYYRYPHLYGIAALVVLLIPPALYLTILSYITPGRNFEKKDLIHFSLFFVFFLLILPFIFSDADSKLKQLAIDKNEDNLSDTSSLVTIILFLLQLSVYWILSYIRFLRYQKNIRLYMSSENLVDLQWLKYFLWSLLFMILLWVPSVFFNLNFFLVIADLCFFIGIFLLSFFSVRQDEIFKFSPDVTLEIKELLEPTNIKSSAKKPGQEKVIHLKEQLTHLMETQKPFLQSDLTLPSLAALLNTSTNTLSYVINAGYDQNFFQFVNQYRIDEVKKQLIDPKNDHLSIVGIGFNSGFNSKTVFNTSFKQSVGMTPSEYRKTRSAITSH